MAGRLVEHLSRLIRSGLTNISDESDVGPTRRDKTLFVLQHQLGQLIVQRRALARDAAEPPPEAKDLLQKAEMAVRKGREDLARVAMSEASRMTSGRQAAVDQIAAIDAEMALLEAAIAHLTGRQLTVEPAASTQASLQALMAELDRLEKQ